MKSFLRKFLVTVSLLSIITIQVEANTLTPPNVQLLGDANGLVHIPKDDLFLHYPNMLPGDSIKRTLEIKNNYEYPYELTLRAERVSDEEEYDLLNKLELKITYKDKVIYAGPTSGEYELTDDISLGVFEPGQEETLVAEVELDGPSTGNEYKNKSAEVDWIFTAVRSEDTNPGGNTNPGGDTKPGGDNDYIDIPQTGDEGVFLYIILGAVSILLITMITKKSKDEKNMKNKYMDRSK